MYTSFCVRTTGANHLKRGLECQDYCLHKHGIFLDAHGRKHPLAVTVVADGHGSEDCFRSALGSRFASEEALRLVIEFVKEAHTQKAPDRKTIFDFLLGKTGLAPAEYEALIKKALKEQLPKSIVSAWLARVDTHFAKNPFAPEELKNVSAKSRARFDTGDIYGAYGTTLIAAAVTEDYWLALHIGDGKLVAFNRAGAAYEPIPDDERCFLNVTTSICDEDAAERCRVYFSRDLPCAVFLGSDGVDDAWPVNGKSVYLAKFYTSIRATIVDKGFDAAVEELQDALPRFSEKGSGDDVSIAGLINLDAVKSAVEQGKHIDLKG